METSSYFSEVVIGFESEEYFVTEGDSQFVEVCVAVGGGQSLDHGYGSTVINVVINSGTATGYIGGCS